MTREPAWPRNAGCSCIPGMRIGKPSCTHRAFACVALRQIRLHSAIPPRTDPDDRDDTHLERKRSGQIKLHGPEAFAGMRRAGRLTAEALDMLAEHVQPGRHHRAPRQARLRIRARTTAPIRRRCIYRGYHKSICTSINHVVCHGIPNDKPLREGDIVNIDVTLILDGWHGDSSRMYLRRRGAAPRRSACARSPMRR